MPLSLSFYNFSRKDLADFCSFHGFPKIHAETLFSNIYRQSGLEFPINEKGLPDKLIILLKRRFDLQLPKIANISISKYDASVKFLFSFHDGCRVEAVIMPEKDRLTLCLSSQVGCAQGCSFCHTGRMGLKRDLSASEIVSQFIVARNWLRRQSGWAQSIYQGPPGRISNIVMMGMGEPLDNIRQVMTALRIFTDPLGLGVAQKRISVSTSGHLDGLKVLLRDFPRIPLALSLHAVDGGLRSRMMPINKIWSLPLVIKTLDEHFQTLSRNRRLLVQYTLIDSVNDSQVDADKLVHLLRNLPIKVNLIPFNEYQGTRYRSPHPEVVKKFARILHEGGIRVNIRFSKGQDITAGCGQLAKLYGHQNPIQLKVNTEVQKLNYR